MNAIETIHLRPRRDSLHLYLPMAVVIVQSQLCYELNPRVVLFQDKVCFREKLILMRLSLQHHLLVTFFVGFFALSCLFVPKPAASTLR